MADVVLKNKDGSPVGYSPVPDKISVPGHDSNNNGTKYKYTRFAAMKMYTTIPAEGGQMVTKKIISMGSNDYFYSGFTENELQTYGSQHDDGTWRIGIVITAKELTVGNIYAASDLYD